MSNRAVPNIRNKDKIGTEPLLCQHCKRINIISQEPYNRRSRVNKHLSVDPYVWAALKRYCSDYGTMNNGLTMILWELEEIRRNELGDKVKDIQVINSNVPT